MANLNHLASDLQTPTTSLGTTRIPHRTNLLLSFIEYEYNRSEDSTYIGSTAGPRSPEGLGNLARDYRTNFDTTQRLQTRELRGKGQRQNFHAISP